MQTTICDYIDFEDLNDDMKLVAQTCGLHVAISLIKNCPGVYVYVPRPEHTKTLFEKYIRNQFPNGVNTEMEIKRISIDTGKSVSFVRSMIAKIRIVDSNAERKTA